MARYGCAVYSIWFLFFLLLLAFLPVWPYSVVWGFYPLLFLLLIYTILFIPAWPYSRGWGYYPSGISGFLLILLALLLLVGIL